MQRNQNAKIYEELHDRKESITTKSSYDFNENSIARSKQKLFLEKFWRTLVVRPGTVFWWLTIFEMLTSTLKDTLKEPVIDLISTRKICFLVGAFLVKSARLLQWLVFLFLFFSSDHRPHRVCTTF